MAYNLEVHREREMGDVVLLWVFLAVGRERERKVVEFGERGRMVVAGRERERGGNKEKKEKKESQSLNLR
jgi:hypothetical protein